MGASLISPPPRDPGWVDPRGDGGVLPSFSPLTPTTRPSTRICSELGGSPGTLALGARGWGAGWARGGCLAGSARWKGVGGSPLPLALGGREADFL